MPRFFGVDVPKDKRSEIALQYIQGIGKNLSKKIHKEANVSLDKRAKDLTEKEVADLTAAVQRLNILVEGDLRREVQQHIKRLIDIRSYRGSRHVRGLPVRGQRTHTNSRTRKGPKKTIGGLAKKAPSPK